MPSYRESHLGRGADYEESFQAIPHRAMMWRLEQRALRSILAECGPAGIGDYLDFACGTGRILSYLGPSARSATGVDISPDMLRVARSRLPTAELICGDLTVQPLLGTREFDLITAFRFFPNAEDELREEAMACLVRHLRPNGILVVNNHRNPVSAVRRVVRALGREESEPEGSRLMHHDEMMSLAHGVGLVPVRIVPLGVVPMDEGYFYGPAKVIELVERSLSVLPGVRILAQNTIYAFRRA